MEIWKDIPEFEGNYQASNYGNIKALFRESFQKGRWGFALVRFPERIMSQEIKKSGYHYVGLCKDGKKKGYLVHRAVLAAFKGVSHMQCNHMDGNKSNNKLDNLEYCTPLQNISHCINVLGKKRGAGSGHAKITEQQALAIKSDTRILREISKDYGISLQAVHYIRIGKNWGWLS